MSGFTVTELSMILVALSLIAMVAFAVAYIRVASAYAAYMRQTFPDQFPGQAPFSSFLGPFGFPGWRGQKLEWLVLGISRIGTDDPAYMNFLRSARRHALFFFIALMVFAIALGFLPGVLAGR